MMSMMILSHCEMNGAFQSDSSNWTFVVLYYYSKQWHLSPNSTEVQMRRSQSLIASSQSLIAVVRHCSLPKDSTTTTWCKASLPSYSLKVLSMLTNRTCTYLHVVFVR